MVMRVQQVEDGYGVLLTADMMQVLDLHDGSEVEVIAVRVKTQSTPTIVHASTEEALKVYRATLPHLHDAYVELAK